MAYMDHKAPKAVRDTGALGPAAAPEKASNQLLTAPETLKFRTYSGAPGAGVEIGNQIRVQANYKGTDVAGRPSSQAVRGNDFSKPATSNPDGVSNRPDAAKATSRPNAETKPAL